MSKQPSVRLSRDVTMASRQGDMRGAALMTIVTVAIILLGHYQTTWSMISIWERSETFAHGFVIAPISAWLIWRQREQLTRLAYRPNPWALAVLIVLGFGWLLASLAHVFVVQQYSLVAMIPVAVWAVLGSQVALAIAFPLAYLLLAVPFGEVFIPALIDLTADFTVTAIQLTGIPIYREGPFFTLPSGSWSVVEACSGLRYLIASFTLGTLYAYLSYRSLKRRLAFIALAIVVPIVANGIRAYIIVMMGHFSGMRLAVGADHLIYGWVFFGLVMVLLYWIGSFWREDNRVETDGEDEVVPDQPNAASLQATAAAAIAAIAAVFVWPAYLAYLDRDPASMENAAIDISGLSGKWEVSATQNQDWKPEYVGTPIRFVRTYQNDTGTVSVYIAEYRHQRPGSQLITSGNVLVPESARNWRNVHEESRRIDLDSQPITVRQNQLHSPAMKLLVWRWYRLAAEETTSPYMAKIILAKHKLLARGDDGAEIIVAASYRDRPDEAVPLLRSFLNDMMPVIRKGLMEGTH